MNTNPTAVKVLCYGDSNTFGTEIRKTTRYASDVRWTGVLQDALGDGFYVIEEGLGGRTTDLDDYYRDDLNGLEYYLPCLKSHQPDIVVLMLGTNDLKFVFKRTSKEIARALEKFVLHTDELMPGTKLVLVAPAAIDGSQPVFRKVLLGEYYDKESVIKSKKLPNEIQKVAEEQGADFIDSNKYVSQGPDGIHWTEQSHADFGKALAEMLKGIIK